MAAPAPEVTALRKLIERSASGAGASSRALRDLRKDVAALLAEADAYLGTGEREREAAAIGRRLELAQARRRAEIREELEAEGRFTGEELDALGFFTQERLDELTSDGTIEAALAESAPVGGW